MSEEKTQVISFRVSEETADINAKDNLGGTPLSYARNNKIADLLRKHGAKK